MSSATESPQLLLNPGTLYEAATRASEHAKLCGALQPIDTRTDFVDDDGVRFMLRILREQRAPKPRTDSGMIERTRHNPFLPHDPNLFVADITPTHLCLLNKYTVIANHLLLVTRDFEHQEQWLTLADFEALCACMAEFEGLAFYNGGTTAGASQPHKHLQYVPFPMVEFGENIPLSTKLATACRGQIMTTLALPFKHAFHRFETDEWQDWQRHSQNCFARYVEMLAATGINPRGIEGGARQTCGYNLLATRQWMLLVPRKRDAYGDISVNGLGFAGHLLARDSTQASFIRRIGPLNILSRVGVPVS